MTLAQMIDDAQARLDCLACNRIVSAGPQPEVSATLLEQAGRLASIDHVAARELAGSLRGIAESPAGDEDKIAAALTVLERARSDARRLPVFPASLTRRQAPGPGELAALERDPRLARAFVSETLNRLGNVQVAVLALEGRPASVQLLNELRRQFHVIRNTAEALGLADMERVVESLDGVLVSARSRREREGAPDMDLILRTVDVLTMMAGDISRRLEGHPAADLTGTVGALIEWIDRTLAGGPRAPETFAGARVPARPASRRAAACIS